MAKIIVPIRLPVDLARLLRDLRHERRFTQQLLGHFMWLNPRRISKIEKNPGVTNFAQVLRLINHLEGRLFVEYDPEDDSRGGK